MQGARSYKVTELLGRGSFGSVYLADTVGTGIRRPVAIKVLRPEQAAIPGLLERLRDEARMLSMIRHRAIVRVDDLLELDGHWSMVMEYIEGCDVATLLADGPFPPRVALAIGEEVANALYVAATQDGPDGRPLRLVHRDVKPGNIRMTAQGEVKLLDFGVARAEFASREAGGTTAVYGTPTYMAPERFRGEDTHAGDVYALGVTLFEMLAGEPPGQSPMELERVPPGLKLAPAWRQIRETSLPLRDLICAMLAHAPEERPPARECARALARIRGQLGGMTLEDWAERVIPPALKARRRAEDGRVGTVMLERPSQASLRVSGATTRAPKRSPIAMMAALGSAAFVGIGAVVVVGGIGAWWFLREPTVAPPEPVVASPPVVTPVAPVPVATPEPVQSPPPEPKVEPPPPRPAPAVATAEPAPARVATPTPAKPSAPTPTTTTRPPKPGTVTGARPVVSTGIVVAEGPVEGVVLTGRPGVYGSGEVPVGEYTAEVTLASGDTVAVAVTVNPERVTRLACDKTSCREVEEW